ncbi:hypothetical protein D3C80_1649520 [compost metagenome]
MGRNNDGAGLPQALGIDSFKINDAGSGVRLVGRLGQGLGDRSRSGAENDNVGRMGAVDQTDLHAFVPVGELGKSRPLDVALFHGVSEEVVGLFSGLATLDDVVEGGNHKVFHSRRNAVEEGHGDVIANCYAHRAAP